MLTTAISDVWSVIDHAHETFIAMDAGGCVIEWNPQAERTFGWSRDEAVGQVLADFIIPPRYRAAHWAGLQRCVETGGGQVLGTRLELSALECAGREFPIELTISWLPAQSPCFCAFLHDISERRANERLLRVQHAIASVFSEAHSTHTAMASLTRPCRGGDGVAAGRVVVT